MSSPIILITGPTAVGKSSISIAWAKKLGAEIISADSMQVYRGMDIGTGKITEEEKDGVPHHLLDVADPLEDYSVARYLDEAVPILKRLLQEEKPAIVVGGTGYYTRALLDGIVPGPPPDPAFRQEMETRAKTEQPGWLHSELIKIDPERAGQLHPNDSKRIIRALEFYHATGAPMSQVTRETPSPPWKKDVLRIGLGRQFPRLDKLISLRVDQMFKDGWIEETQRLLDVGCDGQCTALQAIGYQEIVQHINGAATLEETSEAIKQATRRYSRRQMTFLRPDKRIHWLDLDDDKIPENPFDCGFLIADCRMGKCE
jgi:tRNA dimethylallyltransferase